MIPPVPTVLAGIARSLLTEIAGEAGSAYAQQTLQLSAMLQMMIAQEFDRAAARLVDENRVLRQLFAEAALRVTDPALRSDLQRAAGGREGSLRVPALRAANAALRGLLVRLHAWVDEQQDPAYDDLEQRIWSELVESTRRRHLDLAVG